MARRPPSGGFRPAALALVLSACASLPRTPAPGVAERARAARSYSASLVVSVNGAELRGRARALAAFEKPERLRLEIPGPAGARLVVLSVSGRLLAVFPGERAFFQGTGSASELKRLVGLELTPPEVMDLLLGVAPGGVRDFEVRWGPALPARIAGTLGDGTRVKVVVEDALAGAALPAQAFADPPHDGYRSVAAEEAQRLWSR